jgi:integrase
VHPELAAELASYQQLTGIASGYLFPGEHGHLTAGSVTHRIGRVRLGGTWTAHTLRHRFASQAYAGDRDMYAVSNFSATPRRQPPPGMSPSPARASSPPSSPSPP